MAAMNQALTETIALVGSLATILLGLHMFYALVCIYRFVVPPGSGANGIPL